MKHLLIPIILGAGLGSAPAFAGDDPRLGERVDRICFARSIDNFSTLDEDDAVLLEKGVNDWFKVTLVGACRASQLRFAQSVALDRRPSGGGCLTPGDALVFSDSAFGDFSFPRATRCIVDEIYEWNPDAKAAEDEGEAPSMTED